MKTVRYVLLCLCLLTATAGISQIIYGEVYDAITKQPLSGATVRLNGTTLGTISNRDGKFIMHTERIINASLVISYVGYEAFVINDPYRLEKLHVALEPKEDGLKEVVIKSDTWTREKKLREFRKQFLGKTDAGLSCEILNEEDIDLWFQEENETLMAVADVPLRIRNRLLGYIIEYDLIKFEAKYDQPNRNNPHCRFVFYSGTSFYEEFSQNESELVFYRENRQKEYHGSVMHFMRALIAQDLKHEGFQLYLGSQPIAASRIFEIQDVKDIFVIEMKKNFHLEYKNNERSLVTSLKKGRPLVVYPTGNFTPANVIKFDGELAYERLGNALPLDYKPDS